MPTASRKIRDIDMEVLASIGDVWLYKNEDGELAFWFSWPIGKNYTTDGQQLSPSDFEALVTGLNELLEHYHELDA